MPSAPTAKSWSPGVTRPKLDHLQIWILKTFKPIAPATAVRDIVFNLVFSADGKWLFSHDESGDVNVWDPTTGKRAAEPYRHNSRYPMLFDAGNYSPKSQQLVMAENGSEKDAEWKSEAIVRSSTDWRVVQRVKMDGLIEVISGCAGPLRRAMPARSSPVRLDDEWNHSVPWSKPNRAAMAR